MVCSFGSGRMAVMAKLLASRSFSQSSSEEVGQHKLAAHNLYRQLQEADEANLIDEEDMHVFGLRPMSDPLNLVCCNACKKPVKASHYAAHAEICRSLISAEEMVLEPNGGTGKRKPPRKERRKSLNTHMNQATPVGEPERSNLMEADDTAASEAQSNGQDRLASSISLDVKNFASKIDNKGVSPENAEYSACVMPPPRKRSKHRHTVASDNPVSTKISGKDFQLQSTSGSDFPDCVCVSRYPGLAQETSLLTRDIPAPFATKVYYSQRNNHLRAAITHLYHMSSSNNQCINVSSPEPSQEGRMHLHASSVGGFSYEQVDDLLNKKGLCSDKPDQVMIQSPEACSDKSGATNFSNHFSVDSISRQKSAPIGLNRNKYHSNLYSFSGSSGQSLRAMQQPNGSVPVL